MKIICLMPVRNEDWVLGLSARAVLIWCDALIVMMHRCSDDTEEILLDVIQETDEDRGAASLGLSGGLVNRRVCVLEDYASEWHEMRIRQELLEMGRKWGGTHFALVDADEVLTGDLLPRIRKLVQCNAPGEILMLPWLCMRDGFDSVITAGMWANQNASTAFLDKPEYCWMARDGYDFHQRHPMGWKELTWHQPISDRSSGLMHLQFASRRRLLAKQFWYQLVEMQRWPKRRPVSEVRGMYARTVQESESASIEQAPAAWWAPYAHLLPYLHIDRKPWQEAECKRMLAENPSLAAGLDDFGLLREWGMEGR